MQVSVPTPKTEVLKPLLWIMGFCFSAATATSFGPGTVAANVFMVASLVVLAVTLSVYVYLLIYDRDRLQSEDYMEKLLGDSRVGKSALISSPMSANNEVHMNSSGSTIGVRP